MQDKKLTILYIVLGIVGVIVAGVIGYNLLFGSSPIVVEDFSNKTVAEVDIWAKENNVTVEYSYVYDETIEKGLVISQSIAKETEVKKGSTITITLSQGADPDLEITLPDFTGYTYNQLVAYAAENKLTDVTYDYVENAEIATDIFISHNITTPTMKRSDMIVFTLSLGQSEETTEITVPDFSTYTKTAISNWGTANNVIIKYVTATSKTIDTGGFIKQSPTAGTITYARRTITITYSSGKPVEAINLAGKTKTQVIAWLDENNNRIKTSYVEKYNNDVTKNIVISNSPNSGYLSDGATITVNMSIGKPNVTSYVGQDYSSLTSQVSTLNNSGANLNVSGSQAYSDTVAKGKIISQDKSGEMSTGSTITVVYSKGKQITMSDFVGKTLGEFNTFCSDNGLNGSKTSERYSDSIAANSLISHDPASGATIDQGSTVNYVLSLGVYSPENFVGKTYSYAESAISTANSKAAGWTIVKQEAFNNSYASGVIYQQDISGKTLTVSVSKGSSYTVGSYVNNALGSLPSVSGLTFNKISDGYSDSYTANQIISQSVASGTVIGLPATIDIHYSLGPSAKASMPNLEVVYSTDGKSASTVLSDVKDLLQNSFGFTNVSGVVISHCTTEEKTPGTIWGQTDPGTYDVDYPIFVYIEP